MKTIIGLFCLIFLIPISNLFSQNRDFIEHIELINVGGKYSSKTNTIQIDGEKQFFFEFTNTTEEFILKIFLYSKFKDHTISMFSTSDYEIIDSIFFIDESYYQTKIKFKRIIDNPQLSLKIGAKTPEGRTIISEVKLFPVAVMDCGFVKVPEDMFIGEENFIEIYSNLTENISLSNSWSEEYSLHSRVVKNKGNVSLNLIATQIGLINMPVYFKLKRPIMDSLGNLIYQYGPLNLDINVKSSRLAFLNTDVKDISIDDKNRSEGVEIQIDNHNQLQLQKTYRIENQEAPGGVLIAEIFTKSRLANNKVLCVLKTYNYHSQTDGFMYIKDGDIPKFVTNFSIIPLTKIETVKIMRQGGTWQQSNTVYPGEDIFIRLEGQSLSKAKFSFEDLIITTSDTLANRNDVVELRAKVPIDVRKKNLNLLINNKPSGVSLNVAEFEIFRPFDYIFIDYGEGPRNLMDFSGPAFTPKSIKDIVISFDLDKIDSNGLLYGNQYFDLEIRITGSKGEVLEVLNLTSNMVSPGTKSPRHSFYSKKNALVMIMLNQYLNRKTFDMDNWVRIQMVFKPTKTANTTRADIKTVDIIVQRQTRFDIDVSFPAGLITKKIGDQGYGDLGGISLAMIAQFSFYQKEKINRYRPYKVGAGFIAINALNFADNNAVRDMGVVVIGSLYPTTRESKMTFPLYFGGGYLLASEKWFLLIGPGIRVRL